MAADGTIVLKTEIDESGLKNGLSSLKGGLGALGKSFAVVGAASAATTAAFVKGANATAEYGDRVDKMSQKIGMSAKAFQEWDYIMQINGASVEGLQMGMKTLSNAAQSGAEEFQKLGLSEEFVKSASPEELFEATITQLQGMEESTERTAIASKLLGRNATELAPLLNSDAKSVQELKKQAHDYGKVMSDEAVKASAKFKDSLTTLSGAAKGAKNSLLANLLPALTQITDGMAKTFKGDMSGFDDLTKGFEDLFKKVTEIINKIVSKLPELLPKILQSLSEIFKSIVAQMPEFLDMLLQAVIVGINSLADIAPELMSTVVDAIIEGLLTLLDNLDELIDAGVKLLDAIVVGLVEAIPKIVEAAPQIIAGLVSGLLHAAVGLVEVGASLIGAIWDGMTGATESARPQEVIKPVTTAIEEMSDAAKEAAEKAVKLSGEIENIGKSAKGSVESVEAQAFANSKLADELYDLASQENKTADQKQRMKDIVDQLNGSIDGLNLQLDEERGTLSKTREEVEQYNQAMLTAAKQKIVNDSYVEYVEAEYKAQNNLKNAIDEGAKAYGRYGPVLEEHEARIERLNQALKNGQLSQEQYDEQVSIAQGEWLQAQHSLEQYESAVKDSQKAVKDAENGIEELNETFEMDLPHAVETGANATTNATDIIKERWGEMHGEVEDKVNHLRDVIKSAFSGAAHEMGEAGSQGALNFAEGVSSQSGEAHAAGSQVGASAKSGAADGASGADTVGSDFAAGIYYGMDSWVGRIAAKARQIVLDAIAAAKAAQQSASPAKKTIELGEYFGQGYEVGISNTTKSVTKAASKLAMAALEGIRSELDEFDGTITEEAEESAKAFDNAMKVIQNRRDLGLDDERTYNKRLWQIRDQYLTKYSDKWFDVTKEIYNNIEDINKATIEQGKQAFEAEKKTFDRLRDFGLITEKNYYENIAYLRDKYLDSTWDEWHDITKEIYDFQTREAEATKEKYEEVYNGLFDRIEDLQKRQESLADKLFDFGGVMENLDKIEDKYKDIHKPFYQGKSGRYLFNDLTAQTEELEQYYEALSSLRDRKGMSEELFDVIKNMGYDDSLIYTQKLMKLNDDQFTKYIEDWQKKQETSQRITNELFGDDGKVSAQRVLSDLTAQTDTLKQYYNMLEAVKNRADVPKEFFAALRDMNIDEGLEYANALLELSDADFAQYINDWKEKEKTSQQISKELYRDEADALSEEIEDKFGDVKQSFFDIGKDAAGVWEEGFLAQLNKALKNIKNTIENAFSGVSLGSYGGDFSVSVPGLARGAVLPPNREFLAVLGDQKSGTNIEAPLDTIVEAMNIALANRSVGGGNTEVVLEVDGREFGRAVVEQGNKENRRIGTRLVTA